MHISPSHIIFVILFVVVATMCFLLLRKPAKSLSIWPANIQPGPIRRASLSDALEARVRKFEPVFSEVFQQTHEQWLDGFLRDADPEPEVAIWESIAAAYQSFTQTRQLSLDAKAEAFGLLLVRSAASEQQTLAEAKFQHLSRGDTEQLLHLYSTTPQPVKFDKR